MVTTVDTLYKYVHSNFAPVKCLLQRPSTVCKFLASGYEESHFYQCLCENPVVFVANFIRDFVSYCEFRCCC